MESLRSTDGNLLCAGGKVVLETFGFVEVFHAGVARSWFAFTGEETSTGSTMIAYKICGLVLNNHCIDHIIETVYVELFALGLLFKLGTDISVEEPNRGFSVIWHDCSTLDLEKSGSVMEMNGDLANFKITGATENETKNSVVLNAIFIPVIGDMFAVDSNLVDSGRSALG